MSSMSYLKNFMVVFFSSLINRRAMVVFLFCLQKKILLQDIGTSTLDFRALKPAVLEVFVSPISPGIVYIVSKKLMLK